MNARRPELASLDLSAVIRRAFAEQVNTALRAFLEERHLYQSLPLDLNVAVAVQAAKAAAQARGGSFPTEDALRSEAAHVKDGPWDFFPQSQVLPANAATIAIAEPGGPYGRDLGIARLQVHAPDVKLYCESSRCKRLEPHNGMSCADVFGGTLSWVRPVQQMFVLQYLCQSCKAQPVVFFVRRVGPKMTLVGRSPLEHIAVPGAIPQVVQSYFSGAVVAHQSGHTLSGNFMLRVLIEQWVRAFPAAASLPKADQAIDWYVATLPVDFRSRFPTLRDTYSSLSGDIHAATGSPAVFDDAAAKIEKHFRAWELFELDPATLGAAPSADAEGSTHTTGE